MNKLNVTTRTKVNRLPKRASYDTDVMFDILDDAFVCHIAFKFKGQINIIPTIYGRKDDTIFIHGSNKSRMLKSFESGEEVCVSVTIVDGIVLAKSAFHHSINYRSLIIFGRPRKIETREEKEKALQIIFNHFIPGRWDEIRKPNKKELDVTLVYSFKINEASAKIREGDPIDDKEDEQLNIWAGVLPIKTISYEPIRAGNLNKNIILPEYLKKVQISK
ncbi:MAG TPA: pyridoxamine 5'-phosphate oxidase family protein [Ignavibacteriaceae bacterium]|nr:pyridoxamine 5'-phosphate oxidase family protein [Ignavibacteriaceae bacterium]